MTVRSMFVVYLALIWGGLAYFVAIAVAHN
jgi:hypothetical protein